METREFREVSYGDTIFRSALIRSRNIPTIKIVQDIQVPYLIDYSKRLGFPDHFNNDLSIALGSSTVSLLDICKVYAVFPRGGRKVAPIFINKVVDREGKTLEENAPTPPASPLAPNLPAPPKPVWSPASFSRTELRSPGRVLEGFGAPTLRIRNDHGPRSAYVMTHLMNEVATVGTGHEAKNLGRPAAGKTGTTNDYLDAWFMGLFRSL